MIDSTKWQISSFDSSIYVQPKFEFNKDTTIKFYDKIHGIETCVLKLKYSTTSKCYSGSFIGTTKYPNPNNYIFLNSPDSIQYNKDFKSLFDTIISTDSYDYYCVNYNLISIDSIFNDSFSKSFYYLSGSFLYFSISKKGIIPDGHGFTSGLIIINEAIVPYETKEMVFAIQKND